MLIGNMYNGQTLLAQERVRKDAARCAAVTRDKCDIVAQLQKCLELCGNHAAEREGIQ